MKFIKVQSCGNTYAIFKQDIPESIRETLFDNSFGIGVMGLLIARKDTFGFTHYNNNGVEQRKDANAISAFLCANYNQLENRVCAYNNEYFVEVDNCSRFIATITLMKNDIKKDKTAINSEVHPFLQQKILTTKGEIPVDSLVFDDAETIIWTHTLEPALEEEFASEIAQHPTFPRKTNVHFAKYINNDNIILRSFRADNGFVFSNTAGQIAIYEAAKLRNKAKGTVRIHLQKGTVQITEQNNKHIIEVPAKTIFTGELK